MRRWAMPLLLATLLLAGPANHAAAQKAAAPGLTAASAQGNLVYVDYDQVLDENHTPPPNAYVIRINGKRTTVQNVAVSGQRVTLTLQASTIGGDTVLLTYRHKARPTLRSVSGVNATTVRNVAVEVLSFEAVVETFEPEQPEAASQVSGQAAAECSSGCLDAPSIGVSRGAANDTLIVGWRHVAGATGYEIEYSTQSDFSSATLVEVTVPDPAPRGFSQTISGLTSVTWYYFRAASVNANGRGAWSTAEMRQRPASVATIVPNSDSVTEGQNAEFTVTLSPAPDSAITVTVQVRSVSGSFGVTANTNHNVTVGTGGTGTLTLGTTDDSVEEEDGSITVRVHPAPSGYAKGTPNQVNMTIRDNDGTTQPTTPTATIAAGTSPITEGANAVFTVTLNPAPSSSVTVNYGITVSGNYGVSAATNQTVTVGTGGTGTLTLGTTNDTVDEANGSVTVTLATGTGYTVGTANSASVTVNDDDDPPPAVPDGFSVALGNTRSTLFLQWNHQTGAASYHIQYATNSGFTAGVGTVDVTVPAIPPAQMTYYLGGLTAGTNYWVRVASQNAGGGRSAWSAVGQGRPSNLAIVEPVADTVTEGDAAQFRFSVSPSNVSRTITYSVTVIGDFGVSAATGRTITVTGSQTLDLTTTDDGAIEENGSITVTITGVNFGYSIGTPRSATVAVQDAGLGTDYDTDDDSLIEVDSLAKLNAIRYDPDGDGLVGDNINTADIDEAASYAAAFPNPAAGMGCLLTNRDNPDGVAVCTGYELTAGLDFDTDVSGDANDGDTYWNGGDGWEPIGNSPRFTATFEGNDNTIANLFIDRSRTDYLGLFARLDNATVRNLTLTGATVKGDDRVGVLAGRTYNTTVISGVSVSGDVTAGDDIAGVLIGATSDDTTIEDASASGSVTGNGNVGGLVGNNAGDISRSRSSANVFGDENSSASDRVGGLVGTTSGAITASFATGSVSPLSNADSVNAAGGLIGELDGSIVITTSYAAGSVSGSEDVGGLIGSADVPVVVVTASYATGAVTGTTNAGGLIGRARTSGQGTTTFTDSYWDTESSGLSASAGGEGKTGAELRAPTGYTGIYANWNLDLDNADGDNSHATGQDDPWDFGANYNYPTLRNAGGDQKGPGPVQNLTVVESGGQARATWDAPSGADGTITYELRSLDDDGSGSASWSNWVVVTSPHTLPLPAAGQTLRVEVRAVGTAAHSRSEAASGSVDGPAVQTDYDSDDDGLLEITTLAQLNAIRYDLDGNGVADAAANDDAYTDAFPNPTSNQCDNPVTTTTTETCTGYALTVNLDFDTNGNDRADSGDTYWNSGAGWLPIAGAQNIGTNQGFQATFEGNGHTISNLFINRHRDYAGECAQHADSPAAHSACLERIEWAGYRMGLFGTVGDMAVIRNLTLEDVDVTGEEEVGGLAGISLGAIDMVDVTGDVTGSTIDVGGLVGFLLRGSLIDSTFDGTVSGTASHMGGLVGANTGATIRYSEAAGTVSASGSSSGHVGGLAGSNTGTIAASYSTSMVNANDAYWVGGLVGTNGGPYAKGSGRIIACYANNAVNGKGDVGGLVGENYASISTSYSAGAVHKHGGPYAGPVGGLVGRNELNNNDSTVYYSVTNSYWDGEATSWIFGIGSDNGDSDNVVDSGETNTRPGHTTAQLQAPTDYNGIYATWNVDVDGDNTPDNPWDFGADNQYPVLR